MVHPDAPLTILIVEDAESDRLLIREGFRDCGHGCVLIFADDNRQARKRLLATDVDLIVLDIRLGLDDGLDLVRFVRADSAKAAIPIVVLSGMVGDVTRAYRAGVNAFLYKENSLDQFVDKLRALMHVWIKVAELPSLESRWGPPLYPGSELPG